MADKQKIGDLLVKAGLIDEIQLRAALGHQKRWGGKLGKALVELGFIDEDTMLRFLATHFKMKAVNLLRSRISPETFKLIPEHVAKKYEVVPVVVTGSGTKKTLVLAMSEPSDLQVIDEIQFITGAKVEPVLATDSAIARVLQHYGDFTPEMAQEFRYEDYATPKKLREERMKKEAATRRPPPPKPHPEEAKCEADFSGKLLQAADEGIDAPPEDDLEMVEGEVFMLKTKKPKTTPQKTPSPPGGERPPQPPPRPREVVSPKKEEPEDKGQTVFLISPEQEEKKPETPLPSAAPPPPAEPAEEKSGPPLPEDLVQDGDSIPELSPEMLEPVEAPPEPPPTQVSTPEAKTSEPGETVLESPKEPSPSPKAREEESSEPQPEPFFVPPVMEGDGLIGEEEVKAAAESAKPEPEEWQEEPSLESSASGEEEDKLELADAYEFLAPEYHQSAAGPDEEQDQTQLAPEPEQELELAAAYEFITQAATDSPGPEQTEQEESKEQQQARPPDPSELPPSDLTIPAPVGRPEQPESASASEPPITETPPAAPHEDAVQKSLFEPPPLDLPPLFDEVKEEAKEPLPSPPPGEEEKEPVSEQEPPPEAASSGEEEPPAGVDEESEEWLSPTDRLEETSQNGQEGHATDLAPSQEPETPGPTEEELWEEKQVPAQDLGLWEEPEPEPPPQPELESELPDLPPLPQEELVPPADEVSMPPPESQPEMEPEESPEDFIESAKPPPAPAKIADLPFEAPPPEPEEPAPVEVKEPPPLKEAGDSEPRLEDMFKSEGFLEMDHPSEPDEVPSELPPVSPPPVPSGPPPEAEAPPQPESAQQTEGAVDQELVFPEKPDAGEMKQVPCAPDDSPAMEHTRRELEKIEELGDEFLDTREVKRKLLRIAELEREIKEREYQFDELLNLMMKKELGEITREMFMKELNILKRKVDESRKKK